MGNLIPSVVLLVFTHLSWCHCMRNGTSYGSYDVGPVCYPSQEIRYPKMEEDVVSIVKEAILKGLTVKAFGGRHSTTDVICTDGIPMDMKYFQKKEYNGDGTATFGAGVILWDLALFLKENGRGLITAMSYGNVTIAGAMGTGAHGTTLKYHSTLSEQVIGLTIVDGTGVVRKINSASSLKAFRVHLGLLGVILDVTFKTVPFYKVMAHNYEMSDDILLDGRVERLAKNADKTIMFWFPLLNKIVISNQTVVTADTEGNAYSNFIGASTKEGNMKVIKDMDALQSLPPAEMVAKINASQSESYKALINDGYRTHFPLYTEDGKSLKNPAVGDWFRMVASICPKEGPVQCSFLPELKEAQVKVAENAFSFPLENLAKVVERLKHIITKTPTAFIFNGIVLRFSAATQTYMSLSHGTDTVHLGYFKFKRQNEYRDPIAFLPAYQTFSQSLAMEFKGHPHWGKTGSVYHSTEMINRTINPTAKSAFIQQMKEYDPKGIFLNSFGRRILGTGTKQDTDPKTIHCALLDNCICKKDYDCADSQTCGKIDEYNYNVCK